MTIYVNNPLVLSQSLASVITIYIVFLSAKIKDDVLCCVLYFNSQNITSILNITDSSKTISRDYIVDS